MNERKSEMLTEVRATAETMPLVVVWPTPNGLPIASTRSPTSSASESPMGITGNGLSESIFRTARSSDADHVIVCDHDAAWIDKHAGSERRLGAGRRLATKKLLEEGVALERRARL